MAFQSQRLITCLRLKLLQQPGALNLTCRYWLCPFRHFCYTAVLIFKKHPFSTGKWLRRKPRKSPLPKKNSKTPGCLKNYKEGPLKKKKGKKKGEIWSINTSNNLNVLLVWFKTLVIPGSAKNNRCCSFDGKHTILFIHLMELIVAIHGSSAWRRADGYHTCGWDNITQQRGLPSALDPTWQSAHAYGYRQTAQNTPSSRIHT